MARALGTREARRVSGFATRLICAAATAAAAAVAAYAPLPFSPEGGFVGSMFGAVQAILAGAVAGALLLPGFAGQGRGWLRSAIGGLICAPLTVLLTLAPEVVARGASQGFDAAFGGFLTAVVGALWILAAAGPVFLAAGLLARVVVARAG